MNIGAVIQNSWKKKSAPRIQNSRRAARRQPSRALTLSNNICAASLNEVDTIRSAFW